MQEHVQRAPRLLEAVKAPLASLLERVEQPAKQTGKTIPYVFSHRARRNRGKPRPDYRTAWVSACRETGVPGMLRHDCGRIARRPGRSSARNQRRAMVSGVPGPPAAAV